MGNGNFCNIVWWEIGSQTCGKWKSGSSVFRGMCHCSRSFIAEVLVLCFIAEVLIEFVLLDTLDRVKCSHHDVVHI